MRRFKWCRRLPSISVALPKHGQNLTLAQASPGDSTREHIVAGKHSAPREPSETS